MTTVDTGTSPEVLNRTYTTAGTYTFEVSGYQGDLGDFTFKIQHVTGTAATAQAAAVVLTSKDCGQLGGDQVTAEFKQGAARRAAERGRQRQGHRRHAGDPARHARPPRSSRPSTATPTRLRSSRPRRTAATRAPASCRSARRSTWTTSSTLPRNIERGPFQQHLYRIGTHRDGTKPGVFLFCQQHAREWATGLTCLQTAHELVENYATDPQTKELLDNVEVFISPNSNPDGAHYSMYDFNSQRKTLVNYCAVTGNSDPAARTTWGVDMNRNSGEYSLFDGYFGASSTCTGETYAGPSEFSEPETRNEKWVTENFPNIKFANNIHSYGGYFMWAPGSYKNDGSRTTAPAPNIGVEKYFFEAGEKILERIKDSRGTMILPERTGPIADVLYSAAGNSADDMWYRKGIISYSFETGADRILNPTTGTARDRRSASSRASARSAPVAARAPARPTRSLVNEGRDEALEFAARQLRHGRVRLRLRQGRHRAEHDARVEVSADERHAGELQVQLGRRGGGHPLHDRRLRRRRCRRRRTTASALARVGEVLHDHQARARPTIKWFAVDIKGNQSAVQTKRVLVGASEEPRHRRRLRAGHAVADARRSGHVRRVRPGCRQHLHGLHHGDRDLHGRRRDPLGRRSERGPTPASSSTVRSRCRSPSRASASSRRGPPRPPTRSSRCSSSRRSVPTTPLRTGTYSKSLTFTL